MWFHDELVTLVTTHGLLARLSRVDGLRATLGGGTKAPYLRAHLDALGLDGGDSSAIGDSVDDAHAARAVGAGVVLYAGGFTHPDAARHRPSGRHDPAGGREAGDGSELAAEDAGEQRTAGAGRGPRKDRLQMVVDVCSETPSWPRESRVSWPAASSASSSVSRGLSPQHRAKRSMRSAVRRPRW